jgi:hypothetical protein
MLRMKILILDDDGTTLLEEDNPGYIHLPIIMDGKYDIGCEDDNCVDPRCLERREECEKLLAKWHRERQELAFAYHLNSSSQQDKDLDELERLPNLRAPLKVKLESFTRNEIVLGNGNRIKFLLPSLNVYSDDQVMFSAGKWDASLFPWNEERAQRLAKQESSARG